MEYERSSRTFVSGRVWSPEGGIQDIDSNHHPTTRCEGAGDPLVQPFAVACPCAVIGPKDSAATSGLPSIEASIKALRLTVIYQISKQSVRFDTWAQGEER